MATQKYTADHVIKALRDSRGLVSVAARKLGCDDSTVRNYMARYPTVMAVVVEQRERFVDSAELRLVEAVETKAEPWAIALVLKTLGKHRGYVERTEGQVAITATATITEKHEFDYEHFRRLFSGHGGNALNDNDPGQSVDSAHPDTAPSLLPGSTRA